MLKGKLVENAGLREQAEHLGVELDVTTELTEMSEQEVSDQREDMLLLSKE